ncbi:MAG: hypothetical protein AAF321_04810 [Pseudomonadota bacterium]
MTTLILLSLLQGFLLALLYYGLAAVLGRATTPLAGSVGAFSGFALVGFIAFWTAWVAPDHIGLATSLDWVLIALALVAAWRMPWNREAAVAATLWLVGGVALCLWAFAPTGLEDMAAVARTRWTHPLPGDNVIPLDFAVGLIDGAVPSPLHAGWLSSDRPPLQTGLFLALRVSGGFVPLEASYQVFASVLQMAILPAVYVLLRALKASTVAAILGAVGVFFAPLTIINGTFVWPKLIAAAFLLAAAALHFTDLYGEVRSKALWGGTLGALCAGAMLCHGGSAFAILAFALVALVSGRWSSWRYAITATLAALALYGPWIGYQHFVDPPGDRLLKWHFAGAEDLADPRSLGEAVRDAYGPLSAADIADRVMTKAGNSLGHPGAAYSLASDEAARHRAFFNPIPAMGVMGLPAVAALLVGLFTPLRLLAGTVLVAWALWVVVIWNPIGVVVHQSTLYLWVGALVVLIALFRRWPVVLAAIIALQAGATVVLYAAPPSLS